MSLQKLENSRYEMVSVHSFSLKLQHALMCGAFVGEGPQPSASHAYRSPPGLVICCHVQWELYNQDLQTDNLSLITHPGLAVGGLGGPPPPRSLDTFGTFCKPHLARLSLAVFALGEGSRAFQSISLQQCACPSFIKQT